uniref:ER membrane protein complex subunit 3 n=1 Tax=Meloidogyne javanica TaxID=6303 RepID=A0A915MCK3_MELJA
MTELLLDPFIRTWVFVPIVIITFLVGILRHYIFLLFLGKKKGDLQSVKDGHLLMKARLLRENGRFLPSNSFGMRKHWLADEQNGQLLKRVEKQSSQPNPVPFPLTLRFKPMLQRGVDLMSLDAAWVSSASWYFLNVFGLRSVYALVLGGENAADQIDEQAMMGQPQISQGQDPKAAFKAEWEALQLYTHNFSTK